MSATPKRKLCWNCDGSVPLAVDQCTYCGASLKEGAAPQPVKKASHDFRPPFALHQQMEAIPQPPFDAIGKGTEPSEEAAEGDDATAEASVGTANGLLPMLFLLSGSVFALFGLVLWLFSENGTFTLQWSGDYWYVYLFGGFACLLAGWRTLSVSDDTVS